MLDIISDSFASSIFPTSLKTAVIRPILKKAGLEKNNLNNYLIYHNIFHSHQNAYIPNKSTDTALAGINNDILANDIYIRYIYILL